MKNSSFHLKFPKNCKFCSLRFSYLPSYIRSWLGNQTIIQIWQGLDTKRNSFVPADHYWVGTPFGRSRSYQARKPKGWLSPKMYRDGSQRWPLHDRKSCAFMSLIIIVHKCKLFSKTEEAKLKERNSLFT